MRYLVWLILVCLLIGCGNSAETRVESKILVTPVQGQPQAAPVAAEQGASGRNTVLQVPFDNAAKLVLLNIGRAYQMASISLGKPPKTAGELDAGVMKTKRDMQDREVEVAYGVNLQKLGEDAGKYMLAWEKTPDNDGNRMVLMADLTTVKYVNQTEFDKLPKAK